MGNALTRQALEDLLERLQTAGRDELCQLWSETFAEPPPKGWSQAMLRRALATELQGRVFGTLTKAELRKLESIVPGAASVAPASEDGPADRVSQGQRAAPAPSPGTRLIRTWHGRTYEVTVLEGGKAKLGDETYRSLSAVANAITGTRWSGPLFFGLRDRKKVIASDAGKA